MKKLYPILLMLAVMLGSCSGDDSSNEVQNNNPEPTPPVVTDTTDTPTNTVKLSKIKVTYIGDSLYNNTTTFIYDGDKLISEHKIGEDDVNYKLDYFYNGDKINHVNSYDHDFLQNVYNYTYSGNNIIQFESVSTNNTDNYSTIYSYNQDDQIIGSIFNNGNSNNPTTYTWNANGNIINISSQVTENSTVSYTYEYDNKINPLKNNTLCYPKRGVRYLSNNNITKQIFETNGQEDVWEYEYNDLGYPVKSTTINGQGTEIITEYFYTEN